MTMPSALEISRRATLKPVTEIAADAGLPPWFTEPHAEPTAHPAAHIDADGRVVGPS
jgi:hypothetical protein